MGGTQRRRRRVAYESITRLCGQGLPGGDLFTRLSEELGKTVAFRTAGFQRLDPMTLLPMPGLMLQAGHEQVSRIIHNEYFEADVVKFRELAHARTPAQSLWQATDGQPQRSSRYRTIYADIGHGDDLRVVFRCGTSVWGSACLARGAADPPFSRDDIDFMARISEPVARGLRQSHLIAGDHPAGPTSPGVLIVGDDNSIISLTEAARHWLVQLPPDHAPGLDLPAVIYSAVSQARALAAGRPDAGIPEGRFRTPAGTWLRLHAARLTPDNQHGPGQTAVILEPAGPADLSSLILDLHGLTGRERQITKLLLRGLPTTDIAKMLAISRYTVGDHTKAIFAKLRVTSRAELTALLLDQLVSNNPTTRNNDSS